MSAGIATPPSGRWKRAKRFRLGLFVGLAIILSVDAVHLVGAVRPAPDLAAARTRIARNDDAGAEAIYRAILARSPEDGDALLAWARSLGKRGRMAECASVLHRVPTWWPGKREAEFLEGKAYLEAGHAHDAERAWLAALRDDPLHPTPPQYRRAAVEGLLDLYALEERRPEAIALVWAEYEQAQAEDRPNILIMRFRLEFDRIAPDVALKPLRRYVEADPTDLDARLALARAVGADGKPVEADRLIRGALRTNPSDPTVHRTRIALLGARNDLGALRKAIAELPQSLAVTDDPAIQEARGRVLQADGRLDAAADAYLAALKRRPDDPDFVYRLGIVERTRGRTAEARRLLARSQALRAARTAMKDAYKAYVDATEPGSSAPISVGETAARLARHCRTLGLRREADALSRLHPTADNENGRPSDEGRPPG